MSFKHKKLTAAGSLCVTCVETWLCVYHFGGGHVRNTTLIKILILRILFVSIVFSINVNAFVV